MLVLALDTTGQDCSVSIVDEAVVLAHISKNIGRGHAEVLAGFVEQAFMHANLKPTEIDRLAVCNGPGSFTGLRVALSFAKGFALPRNLPVVGMDALHLTSWENQPDAGQRIGAYRDIRRGEVFYGVFRGEDVSLAPHAIKTNELPTANREAPFKLIEASTIDTRILAWLSMDIDPADYPAEPLYSRGPDAKLPGGKTLAKPKT